jgi:peptidoglycan/LPS O-acetylase OafA/YrhL
MNSKKYDWFDLLRGLAAFLVIISHLRGLLFDDYTSSHNYFKAFFYFVTGFGKEAVVIFFVLSGFFITKTIHSANRNNKWSFKYYFFNRIVRLWVVLIPSLVFTLVLDSIGFHFFNHSYIYLGLVKSMPEVNLNNRLGFGQFFGNLFFLQTILVKTFGTNSALWSLANEFWYYIMFPFIYFLIENKYTIKVKLVFLVFLVSILMFLGKDISLYFLIWLMGSVVYYISEHPKFQFSQSTFRFLMVLIFFIITLVGLRYQVFQLVFNMYSLGLITSILLVFLAQVEIKSKRLRTFALFISKISYSVYLFHLSFIVFIISACFTSRVSFSALNMLYYFMILFVALFYCYCCYLMFERKTNEVKQILQKKVLNQL